MIRHVLLSVAASAAVVAALGTSSAQAQIYEWTIPQINDLNDVTTAFGGDQLSTINSITPIPDGIELDVTFRIGQNSDPFAPDFGATFSRVSLSGSLGFPGLDISAFTSSQLKVSSTHPVTVQSFLQTDFTEDGGAIDDGDGTPDESFSFLFWEQNDGIAAGGPTDVNFDFAAGTEFDGNWNVPSPSQVQGTNAVRQWGVQFGAFNNPPVLGQPINATIQIIGVVPEPGSAVLVAAALASIAGVSRRGRSTGLSS